MSKEEWRSARNLVLGLYLGFSAAWTGVSILNWFIELFV